MVHNTQQAAPVLCRARDEGLRCCRGLFATPAFWLKGLIHPVCLVYDRVTPVSRDH